MCSSQRWSQNHTCHPCDWTRPSLLALGRDLHYPQNLWKRLPGVTRLVLVCVRRTVKLVRMLIIRRISVLKWSPLPHILIICTFLDVTRCIPSTRQMNPAQTWSWTLLRNCAALPKAESLSMSPASLMTFGPCSTPLLFCSQNSSRVMCWWWWRDLWSFHLISLKLGFFFF